MWKFQEKRLPLSRILIPAAQNKAARPRHLKSRVQTIMVAKRQSPAETLQFPGQFVPHVVIYVP